MKDKPEGEIAPPRSHAEYCAIMRGMALELSKLSKRELANRLALEIVWMLIQKEFHAFNNPILEKMKSEREKAELRCEKLRDVIEKDLIDGRDFLHRKLHKAPTEFARRGGEGKGRAGDQKDAPYREFLGLHTGKSAKVQERLLTETFPALDPETTEARNIIRRWRESEEGKKSTVTGNRKSSTTAKAHKAPTQT